MKCLGFPQNIIRDHPEAVRSGPTADLTFTITTCRRRELFERTMDSFLENCLDHHLISRWICVDDLKKMRPQFRSYFQNIIDMMLNQKENIKSFIQKSHKKNPLFSSRL